MPRVAGATRHRSVATKPFGPASKEAPPQGLYGVSGLWTLSESNRCPRLAKAMSSLWTKSP